MHNIFGDAIDCSSTVYLSGIAANLMVKHKSLLKILLAASQKSVNMKAATVQTFTED